MNKIKLAALLFLLIGLSACLKDYSTPNYEDVEGVVLLNDEPVENANIHIRHILNPGGTFINNVDELTINFRVQSAGEYVGNLYRYGENEPFSKFLDKRLQSGPNQIPLPDTLLSNGLIGYEISGNFGPITAGLLTVSRPDSLIPSMVPITETNSSGAFTLSSFNLPLGESFTRGTREAFEVTDSLEIIVTDQDQILKIERVKIEPDQANFFEINLD